jgi:hypothetical protein
MPRRQRLTQGELQAEAEMAKRREERLDEKGLCRFCGERPKNPFINANTCLSCYKEHPNGCCTAEGCYDNVAARYEQMALCKVHLADTLHKEYERYLSLKDKLHEKEQKLGFFIIKRDYDTNEKPEEIKELENPSKEIQSLQNRIKMIQREIDILKSGIKKANKKAGGVFPENYEIFG